MIQVYTDGSTWPNPGPGGWAWWISDSWSGHGHEPGPTTNQRMELLAVIQALHSLPRFEPLVLYTDSAYVFNAVTKGWLDRWAGNGWRTADHKSVKNQDLWMALRPLLVERPAPLTFVKIRGHVGIHGNEQADRLAGSWRDVV